MLGAQQHVLCHGAHEGNTSLLMTSVSTCVTCSQLVTATDLTALLIKCNIMAAILCQVSPAYLV